MSVTSLKITRVLNTRPFMQFKHTYIHACDFFSLCVLLSFRAGIGMTPCASILTAMLKYRWRFGQPPEKLHFYWVVQHNELDAFQW